MLALYEIATTLIEWVFIAWKRRHRGPVDEAVHAMEKIVSTEYDVF